MTGKQAGSQSAPLLAMSSEPATPASLMKIQKQDGNGVNGYQGSPAQQQNQFTDADMEQIMEDITLPEPATSTKPMLRPINTSRMSNDDQSTPTMSAQMTPKLEANSAPLTATSSMVPSPQLGALGSKRVETKSAGRGNKKRNSTHSVHASPALRPKISPNIKPLLPDGVVIDSETSALLLASKSNYQNILEGTHLPGVSYPEALSTNLTSKRTSHKIAEQGRRNRINNALQEIAALLPPTTPTMSAMREGSGSSGDNAPVGPVNMMSGTAAQQSNSKASTVEMAIDYIKALQKELKDTKDQLEVAEKKLGDGDVATKVEV